jgi:hypothetical protein
MEFHSVGRSAEAKAQRISSQTPTKSVPFGTGIIRIPWMWMLIKRVAWKMNLLTYTCLMIFAVAHLASVASKPSNTGQ